MFSTWYGRIQCCEVKEVDLTLLYDIVELMSSKNEPKGVGEVLIGKKVRKK